MALETIESLLLESDSEVLWELFHENSKASLVERHVYYTMWPSSNAIASMMKKFRRVKPYTDCPKVALPDDLPASTRSFDEVLLRRATARALSGESIDFDQLAKILLMSYGVTRDNVGTDWGRPFRVIPSGGGLYPLEIYFYAHRVNGLDPGLYHYDPEEHELDVLRTGEDLDTVTSMMVQPELAEKAAAVLFVAAVFFRTTFKYGDRGYRFVLLEAGHFGQNATLAAQEMDLATVNIGGYLDRQVDRYLGLDGVNESTVYAMMIGHPEAQES